MSQLILLTDGSFSDYRIYGLYEIPSWDWCEERYREYTKDHPAPRGSPLGWDPDGFVEWFCNLPEVRRHPFREAWIGFRGTQEEFLHGGLYDKDEPRCPWDRPDEEGV